MEEYIRDKIRYSSLALQSAWALISALLVRNLLLLLCSVHRPIFALSSTASESIVESFWELTFWTSSLASWTLPVKSRWMPWRCPRLPPSSGAPRTDTRIFFSSSKSLPRGSVWNKIMTTSKKDDNCSSIEPITEHLQLTCWCKCR